MENDKSYISILPTNMVLLILALLGAGTVAGTTIIYALGYPRYQQWCNSGDMSGCELAHATFLGLVTLLGMTLLTIAACIIAKYSPARKEATIMTGWTIAMILMSIPFFVVWASGAQSVYTSTLEMCNRGFQVSCNRASGLYWTALKAIGVVR